MKPLVSAAAAVFLLAARRKPPETSPTTDTDKGADADRQNKPPSPPSSTWPLLTDGVAEADFEYAPQNEPSKHPLSSETASTSTTVSSSGTAAARGASKAASPSPQSPPSPASPPLPAAAALIESLRQRSEAGDDSSTALGMLRRGLRVARRAAARKAAEDARAGGAASRGARKDGRDLLGTLFGDVAVGIGGGSGSGGDGSEEVEFDVRPLLAVSMGVTLFLLTRSPRDGYAAELERTGDGGGGDVGAEALRMLESLRMGRLEEEAAAARAATADTNTPVRANRRGADSAAVEAAAAAATAAASAVNWPVLSDMRGRRRNIVIVTTAALPWMTGTAVNPLLRAVYLAKAGHTVTLVVPWLESPEDQRKVFPKDTLFASKDAQKAVILEWAHEQVEGVEMGIRFFEGVYSNDFGSIMPLGDLTSMFADDEVRDVCVLEEPEHLTWHHTGKPWTKVFDYSIGIIHTNYTSYARESVFGPASAVFLHFLNQWCARAYCHRVIKLSDAVQEFPHSVTCNVHGVRDHFLEIGRERRGKPFEKDTYFLGKVLWTKGYRELVDLMEAHTERTGQKLAIDFFGAGPDLSEVKARVRGSSALSEVNLHGVVVQHHSEYLQRYKVFVNPSKSDVVCTATAEALAMGKFVVCLKHPSNEFFSTFENCLIYETDEEFSAQLAYARANNPAPLSARELHRLSWEAATERFYDASLLGEEPGSEHAADVRVHNRSPMGGRAPPGGRVDTALAVTHKTICSTLVATPASVAVRQRYRAERKVADEARRQARQARKAERVRSRIVL